MRPKDGERVIFKEESNGRILCVGGVVRVDIDCRSGRAGGDDPGAAWEAEGILGNTMLYNEHDAYAAEWLYNLMNAGLIGKGKIDGRSITEVSAKEAAAAIQFHAFAGIGGWPLALRLAGWPDKRPVWTGSCPCQPFSCAGKRKGKKDRRHLWPDFFRLINECRPSVVFGEQVASKDGLRWLDGIRADLEGSGYAFGAADLCAAGSGTQAEGWIVRGDQAHWERIVIAPPHIRQRLFWVGIADGARSFARRRASPAVRYGRAAFAASGAGGLSDAGRADDERRGEPGESPCTPGAHQEAGNQRQRRGADAGDRGATGRLPDSRSERRDESAEVSRSGNVEPVAEHGGESDGLPVAPSGRRGQGHADGARSGERTGAAAGAGPRDDSADVGMGIAGHVQSRSGRTSGLVSAERTEQGIDLAAPCIIYCRDGKLRRVSAQPGDEPLAHGIPSKSKDKRLGRLFAMLVELGHSPEDAKRIIREARSNRVGRLRGYANAIVPQVAAVFVRSVMEVLEEG